MSTSRTSLEVDFDEPIVFRTTSSDLCDAALKTGSIWLRSGYYYRNLEDKIRKDDSEGTNGSTLTIPLRPRVANGPQLEICGTGQIGKEIAPHYILSLHGPCLAPEQLRSFGEYSFGIRSISKLSAEVLYRSSLVLKCVGYRYGQVSYQYAPLALSHSYVGTSAICIGGTPPAHLNPMNIDVLRKRPILPFVEQDEWRIAIITEGYLGGDPMLPLMINVDPKQFYAYHSGRARH
jgi:hypothetical protein